MDFQRLVLFVIFCMSGLFLFQAWQKENNPQPPAAQVAKQDAKKPDVTASTAGVATKPSDVPAATPGAANAAPSGAPVTSAAPTATEAKGEVLVVKTDLADYKINTLGGVMEEVALKKHGEVEDKAKPYRVLLKTEKRKHVAQTGLTGSSGVPDHYALYNRVTNNTELAPGSDALEVRLSTPLASGGKSDLIYTFKRGSYVVEVTREVTNSGSAPIAPSAYFQLQRDSVDVGIAQPLGGGTFHGPIVFTEAKKYQKVSYSDVEKGKAGIPTERTSNGWIGMVEHFFVGAWLPASGVVREYYMSKVQGDTYLSGMKTPLGEIAPGATAKVTVPLFVGPQEQDLLVAAAPELDRVVDYGVFAFVAKPMFWLLKWFYSLVGNWGWAIVLLTVLVKAAFYPLNAAAGRSMGKMKLFAPKMKEMQERYAGDRMKLNQAMMELYKKEKINPMGGCLPILVQLPVFFALFWVLSGAVELRHAPWIGWIRDLSAPDPWFLLPVVYAITAFAQAKLQPPAPGMDPMQQKILMYMPVAFAVMFVFFPAGLVLYWTVSNILQIAQQWQINKMLEKEQAATQALLKR
jgi:YidC/Oxa1 family membrane protein insertase